MSDENKMVFWGLALVLIVMVTLAVLTGGLGRIIGREFQKFDEETRTQVMEESRTYQEGMAQNLDKLCVEWSESGNAAVAQSIRHRSAGFNGELPPHIQQCVDTARKAK